MQALRKCSRLGFQTLTSSLCIVCFLSRRLNEFATRAGPNMDSTPDERGNRKLTRY
jgi:hypothetical protein